MLFIYRPLNYKSYLNITKKKYCIVNFLQVSACFSRPSKEERKILEEIVKLKAEQNSLSIKDDFAAYSKLQRKINKLEATLKDNSQTRISRSLAIKGSVHIILQVILAAVIVVSVFWFRREPIVAFNTDLAPITNILQYPSETPNAISTHIWVLISNVSIRSLLKPVLS